MEGTKSKQYVDLAGLLQKPRAARAQKQVEEILGEKLALHEKLNKIKLIDKRHETGKDKALPSINDVSFKAEFPTGECIENPVTILQAKQNRAHIKRRPEKAGFFNFLFFEYKKISRFFSHVAPTNYIAIMSFFPPSYKISKQVETLFTSRYIVYAQELLPFLERLLHCAWRSVTKFEYNLVFQFYEFCRKLAYTNPRALYSKKKGGIDAIKKLEELFLGCVYEQDYAEIIFDALAKIPEHYPEWNFNIKEMLRFSRRLLYEGAESPSFANVMVGLNIIKYKRFLSLSDLFPATNCELFSRHEFECSKEIQEKIDEFLTTQEERLFTLIEKKREIEEYNSYLPKDEAGSISLDLLETYYTHERNGHKLNFELDCEQVPSLILNFGEMLLTYFDDLLTASVVLHSGQTKQIFGAELFQYEFDRLRVQLEKLARLKYTFKNFTFDRYMVLQHLESTSTSTELEVMQSIAGVLEIAAICAKKMMEIMRLHHWSEKNEEAKDTIRRDAAVDQNMINSKDLAVPFFNEAVDESMVVSGRSVGALLQEFISLNLMISIQLKSSNVASLLSEGQRLSREIRQINSNIKRIATQKRYTQYISKYGLSNEPELHERE